MKKFISIILCTLLILPTLIFVGCKKCEHEFVWKVFSEGSCTEKQVEEGLCLKCGEKSVRTVGIQHLYEDGFCLLCGKEKELELSQDIISALITEEDVKSKYLIKSIKNYEVTAIWLDNSAHLNLSIYYKGFDLKIRHGVKLVNYESTQGNSSEVYGFRIEYNGDFIVYYSNNVSNSIGNIDSIKGIFINGNREVFVVSIYNDVQKIGKLKFAEPVVESSFFFEERGNEYYVTGYANCSKEELVIPNTYNGKNVVGISAYAFRDMKHLKKVVFGDNIESVGDWAFYGCSNLTEITFGATVKELYSGVFYNTSLKTINYKGSVAQKESIVISNVYNNFSNIIWNYI